MGNYSVPESIRQYKPKGTMVKRISNYYYVYEYSNYTDSNGKRHTKMGKAIGIHNRFTSNHMAINSHLV